MTITQRLACLEGLSTPHGLPHLSARLRRALERSARLLGIILRRCRLEEALQFISILRGAMSLVSPRPEAADNVATFSLSSRSLASATRCDPASPAGALLLPASRKGQHE